MKNKTLIYLLLGAGVLVLISAKKKAKGYTLTVPAPEKISREQFEKPSLIQKAAPVVKKLVTAIKKKKAEKKKIGNFPDIY